MKKELTLENVISEIEKLQEDYNKAFKEMIKKDDDYRAHGFAVGGTALSILKESILNNFSNEEEDNDDDPGTDYYDPFSAKNYWGGLY